MIGMCTIYTYFVEGPWRVYDNNLAGFGFTVIPVFVDFNVNSILFKVVKNLTNSANV